MAKARIPLAQQISTRDGTLTKDAKLVNCMVEKSGDKAIVNKRPGMYTFAQFPAGLGQGLFTINGVPYAIFSDVLYLCIPPMTSFAIPLNPSGNAPLQPLPTPAPLPQYAIFGGGNSILNVNGYVAATDKYAYTNNLVISGAYLITSSLKTAAGNYSVGVFAVWTDLAYVSPSGVSVYTYSNDVVFSGSELTQSTASGAAWSTAATGNSAVGIFSEYFNFTGGMYSLTTKYFYNLNATAGGTALGLRRVNSGACGTASEGIFAGGSGNIIDYTDIYIYSGDVLGRGTNLGLWRGRLAAAGNTSQGIFAGGITQVSSVATNYTDIYTYAGNVVTPGTVLGLSRLELAAAGNVTEGVFGGGALNGFASLSAYTDIYNYAGNVVTSGTALKTARYGLAATSTSPGGF